jgi:hypothetical protein
LARRPAAKRRAGGGLRRRARVECDAPQLLRSHDCASSASSARDRGEEATLARRGGQRGRATRQTAENRRRGPAPPASILAASPRRATTSVATGRNGSHSDDRSRSSCLQWARRWDSARNGD